MHFLGRAAQHDGYWLTRGSKDIERLIGNTFHHHRPKALHIKTSLETFLAGDDDDDDDEVMLNVLRGQLTY